MPEPPKGMFARKGTKAGNPPHNGSKRTKRVGAAGLPAKNGKRAGGRVGRGNGRNRRNQSLVFAPPVLPRGGFRLASLGANTTHCTIVVRVFDVTPTNTGVLNVVLPTAATDIIGTNCCHLGPGLSYRHAALSAAFQRVRVSAIEFSWESMCPSTTPGVVAAAILSEYSHAAGVGAVPADYNTLLQKAGAVDFRPWSPGKTPFLRWKRLDQRDGELMLANRNSYTRADDIQYLMMLRGEGLPTATTVSLGKIVVRIQLDYMLQE